MALTRTDKLVFLNPVVIGSLSFSVIASLLVPADLLSSNKFIASIYDFFAAVPPFSYIEHRAAASRFPDAVRIQYLGLWLVAPFLWMVACKALAEGDFYQQLGGERVDRLKRFPLSAAGFFLLLSLLGLLNVMFPVAGAGFYSNVEAQSRLANGFIAWAQFFAVVSFASLSVSVVKKFKI